MRSKAKSGTGLNFSISEQPEENEEDDEEINSSDLSEDDIDRDVQVNDSNQVSHADSSTTAAEEESAKKKKSTQSKIKQKQQRIDELQIKLSSKMRAGANATPGGQEDF